MTSALNARTAAEALRQREFDLVLLDINLPDGNGFELCKLIKPQHPDTIVIFLTANDQESDQIRGYEVGAVDYITKPFVIVALQRKIKAMFAMLEHHKPAKNIYDDGRLIECIQHQIIKHTCILSDICLIPEHCFHFLAGAVIASFMIPSEDALKHILTNIYRPVAAICTRNFDHNNRNPIIVHGVDMMF